MEIIFTFIHLILNLIHKINMEWELDHLNYHWDHFVITAQTHLVFTVK